MISPLKGKTGTIIQTLFPEKKKSMNICKQYAVIGVLGEKKPLNTIVLASSSLEQKPNIFLLDFRPHHRYLPSTMQWPPQMGSYTAMQLSSVQRCTSRKSMRQLDLLRIQGENL